jgi:hypothetical protein
LKSLTLTSVRLTHVTFQVSSNRPKGIQLPLAGVPMCLPSQGRQAPPALSVQGAPPASPFARQGGHATPPVGQARHEIFPFRLVHHCGPFPEANEKTDMKHGINEAFTSSLSTKTSLQQSLSLHQLCLEIGSIPATPGDRMTSCLAGKNKVLKKHRQFISRHLHPFYPCILFCHVIRWRR